MFDCVCSIVLCGVCKVYFSYLAKSEWAQVKPPHTVACWCLSDPGLYRLVKWVKCMWKILKIALEGICTQWSKCIKLVIWTWFVKSVWKGCSGRHRLSWSSYWLVHCPWCAKVGSKTGQSVVFRVFIFLKTKQATRSIKIYLKALQVSPGFENLQSLFDFFDSWGWDCHAALALTRLVACPAGFSSWWDKPWENMERLGKTWKDLRLFRWLWLPSGGHCWVLGWSDQSGQLSLRQSQQVLSSLNTKMYQSNLSNSK